MSDEKKLVVERVIDQPAKDIFDVLSNPQRHAEIDGSGFVKSDDKTDRITEVGQVFRMNMEGDHMGGEYNTENHVTGYEANKRLAWQTAPEGVEPPGWQWVWELDAQGADSTLVRLTYDWSGVTDQALLKKVGFPLVSAHQLDESLSNLASATGS